MATVKSQKIETFYRNEWLKAIDWENEQDSNGYKYIATFLKNGLIVKVATLKKLSKNSLYRILDSR